MVATVSQFDSDGFIVIKNCLTPREIREWCERLTKSIEQSDSDGRLQAPVAHKPTTYGIRNLVSICPAVVELLCLPVIAAKCTEILGKQYGLVRGLYFDKPPGLSWSLPWHQDLTIAVAEHRHVANSSLDKQIDGFSKPTTKAGICHVEAPTSLLEKMLTVRFHLDAMHGENGPVVVRKGSHQEGKLLQRQVPIEDEITEIHCPAGSAMLMRPLLSHSSVACKPDSHEHRRTIHLELAPTAELSCGFRWQAYIPIGERGGQ